MFDLIRINKSLSDETRLRILNLLLERECCVCEVVQALNISQTRASRNLSLLYNAGLIKLRREGLWSLYSINKDSQIDYLPELLNTIKKALKDNQTAISDRERLKEAVRRTDS
jgi:ArsR family transcriptional regulator, arsenate/arsenite/antimonite-responsive transcriptional repressor